MGVFSYRHWSKIRLSQNSFLCAAHVIRTMGAHKITSPALYILQHHVYGCYCARESTEADDQAVVNNNQHKFDNRSHQREEYIPLLS